MSGRRWWLACGLVLAAALTALVPTTGDFGLTWDEPAYRYSQQVSSQWWEQLARARSRADLEALLDPEALLYYWPYARHGINFHPTLSGQLNLLTYSIFGSWMKDVPARRMSSVIEFALTVAMLFGFLARRYGPWVGAAAAGSLLLMPRVYADAHVAGTDMPGLFLWSATALAFWKGLHDPDARRWRVAVGVLLGLAFVQKMGAVMVLLPLLAWLVLARLPASFRQRGAWVDGVATTAALLVPLGVAGVEVLRLAKRLPQPKYTDLFIHRPQSDLPGVVLLVPLLVWVARRLIGRLARNHPIWGAERPALETWTAILAFAPAVGWLGNPSWWRETFPRLAHYYLLNFSRRGSLPDIQIIYWGQTYEYSLPWHNAWVLIAITVPAAILIAAVVGLIVVLPRIKVDRLPLFFLVNLAVLPALRMLPTPAHDGVRLFLPTFFFLGALAGWGTIALTDGLARVFRMRVIWFRSALTLAVLGSAGWQLVKVHPYEMSYYNELIGGPRGAWRRGFELSYWYDALNGPALDAINRKLPPKASLTFANELSAPMMVIADLQALGQLRSDIETGLGVLRADHYPYMLLLTHDSKASAFSRLLYAMTPWYEVSPPQLDGARVLTVADPEAVSRAWALWLLTDAPDTSPPPRPAAPTWVRQWLPPLARLWGDGVTKVKKLTLNERVFRWAKGDPDGLRAAARDVAAGRGDQTEAGRRLIAELSRYDRDGHRFVESLLLARPEAVVEAVDILDRRGGDVRRIMTRYAYTDPKSVGGYLDDVRPIKALGAPTGP